MANFFTEKSQEESYLRTQSSTNIEKAEYDLASSLYSVQTFGRSLKKDTDRVRREELDQEKNIWNGVGKVLDWVLTPLSAPGAGILAPIGHDYKSDGLGAILEGGKVSGEAFLKTLIPGWGDDEENNYARQVVDKYSLAESELGKTSVALGLDLLADPTILLGLPMLKMAQKGLRGVRGVDRLSRFKKIGAVEELQRTAKISEKGEASFWSKAVDGVFGNRPETDEYKEILALAKKADNGDKGAFKEFTEKVDNSAAVNRLLGKSDLMDQSDFLRQFDKTFKLPDNEVYALDRHVTPEDLLLSGKENKTARTLNVNTTLLTSDKDVQNLFENLNGIFNKDYTKLLNSLSLNEKKLMESSQAGLLGDFFKKNVESINPKEAYAGRQLMASVGSMVTRLAMRAYHGSDFDKLAFDRGVALLRVTQEKVMGVAKVYGRNLWSFSVPVGDDFNKFKVIEQALNSTKKDFGNWRLMKKLVSASSGDPATVSRLVERSTTRVTSDAMHEIFVNSVLSGFTTHAVNLTSTASRLALEPLKHGMASVAALARLDVAAASEHFHGAVNQTVGMLEGFVEGLRLGAKNLSGNKIFGDLKFPVKIGESADLGKQLYDPAISGSKFGLTGGLGKTADWIGWGVRQSGNWLMREDRFMKVMAYRMDVNMYAGKLSRQMGKTSDERRIIFQMLKKDPPDTIKELGIKAADEYTFHTKLGSMGESVNNVLKTVPGMRWMVPFFRTPTNLVNQGLQHTPFGVFYKGIRDDMFKASAAGDLARVKISLGPMMAGGLLSLMGENVTGRIDPRTPNGRFQHNNGDPRYSLKIDGNWYSYEKIEPLRFMIGSAISLRDILTHSDLYDPEEKTTTQKAVDTFTGVLVGTATDNYMLQQMGNIYGMLWAASKGQTSEFFNAMQEITVAMRRPQLIAQWEKQRDGYYRVADSYLGKLMKKTWGASSSLYAHRNAYGDKIAIPHGWGPDIISPIPFREDKPDFISKAIIDSKANIQGQIKKIKNIKLSPEERDYVNKIAGQGFGSMPPVRDTIKKYVNSQWWVRASANTRKDAIENIFNRYRQMARDHVFAKSTRLRDEYTYRQKMVRGLNNDSF